MSKVLFLFAHFALALLLPATGLTAQSSMHITLYASGATVTEQREVAVKDNEIRLLLPLSAQTRELRLTAEGADIVELRYKTVSAPKKWRDDALYAAIRKAEQQVAELEGQKKTIETRLALWSEPRFNLKNIQEMEQIDARLAERIAKLHGALHALKEPLATAQAELARLKAQQNAKGETAEALELAARLTPNKGTLANPLRVNLTYHLKNCGWKPIVRLNAQTDKNTVELTRLAVIEQKTGQDWSRVALTLSTLTPTSRLAPPELFDWNIGSRPMPNRMSRKNAEAMQDTMSMHAAAPMMASTQPTFTEQASSGLWSLGVRTVPSGEPVQIALDAQQWKADFYRLLRPAVDNTAYLEARVTLPEAVTIPTGTAQYSVDGALVGSRMFSFSGTEGTIGFGTDPAVTAKMTANSAQSGSKGFIDKQQTYDWNWTITVSNAHKTPITARVEEPEPQARDKAIEVTVNSTPPAENDGHTLVWNLSVPAEGKESIRHSVSFTAPKELNASPGR